MDYNILWKPLGDWVEIKSKKLGDILGSRWSSLSHIDEINVGDWAKDYLEGLCDAGIKEAQVLLSGIKKYGTIRIILKGIPDREQK